MARFDRLGVAAVAVVLACNNGGGGGSDTESASSGNSSSTGMSAGSDSTSGGNSMSDSSPTTTEGGSMSATASGTTSGTTEAITSGMSSDTTSSTVGETTGGETTVGETTDTTGGDTTGGDTTGGDTTGGDSTGGDSTGGDTTGGVMMNCGELQVTYRDHKPLDVDFGCHMFGNIARPGLVMQNLGMDKKPVYNPNPPPPPGGWNGSNPQITSAQSFAEWYNTMPGVNFEVQDTLTLTEIMPGLYSFASNNFYPLTGKGFGNNITPNWAGETFPDRNGSFTTEIHTSFIYEPGQVFNFQGDDDVWVFINNKLAMDLGGLHPQVSGAINLDTLGLTPGAEYPLDVFHAERCESGSNFRIDTSINCFIPQ